MKIDALMNGSRKRAKEDPFSFIRSATAASEGLVGSSYTTG